MLKLQPYPSCKDKGERRMKEKKGKCYSKVNMGQRKKGDFYQTPYSMTTQICLHLVNRYNIYSILEPAAGEGSIIKVLKEFFPESKIYASDLYRKINKKDFLSEKDYPLNKTYSWIITNPPYSLANEFIQKAKQIAPNVLMLLPLNYLQGEKRFKDNIFKELKDVFIFTRMPMLSDRVREDGKYQTGMQAYAWYHWQKDYSFAPEIHWISNQEYVLKKGGKG